MTENSNVADVLQSVDPTQLVSLISGLSDMQAIKSPDKMYYCKITQADGTKCWGFLSPYDDRLEEVTDKVEVTIDEHQSLISGGQIVYYDGKLFNSDKYKLDENYDFIPNENYEEEQTAQRKSTFESQFFQIPTIENTFVGGWYRKVPKGYASALESLNTAYNAYSASLAVDPTAKFPADTLIFYTAPDYSDAEQCTEEWLIAHQFKNTEMTSAQFMQFYSAFVISWNMTEH